MAFKERKINIQFKKDNEADSMVFKRPIPSTTLIKFRTIFLLFYFGL